MDSRHNALLQKLICELYSVFFRLLADNGVLPRHKLQQVCLMTDSKERAAELQATLQQRLKQDLVSFEAFWEALRRN
jgi:Ca2+-binding EF-hand superfamily protein